MMTGSVCISSRRANPFLASYAEIVSITAEVESMNSVGSS